MYCVRHLLLFTCKQGCLQTWKYDQSFPVMETYVPSFMLIYGFLFELWVLNLYKKKMKNSAHPYIQSTTVLCDHYPRQMPSAPGSKASRAQSYHIVSMHTHTHTWTLNTMTKSWVIDWFKYTDLFQLEHTIDISGFSGWVEVPRTDSGCLDYNIQLRVYSS